MLTHPAHVRYNPCSCIIADFPPSYSFILFSLSTVHNLLYLTESPWTSCFVPTSRPIRCQRQVPFIIISVPVQSQPQYQPQHRLRSASALTHRQTAPTAWNTRSVQVTLTTMCAHWGAMPLSNGALVTRQQWPSRRRT